MREFADTELIPSGLSEQRKRYLFDEIRPFCDEKYQDVTCPEPRVSRKRSLQSKREKFLAQNC